MAFTEAELIKIRTYVGLPAFKTYDTAFEARLELMAADPDRKAAILAQLATLDPIEQEITDGHGFAHFSKAEELTLDPNRYRHLRANGRRECRKLASMIGIEVFNDVFSTGWGGGSMPMG